MLVHVIDAASIDGRDPIADYEKLNAELEGHDEHLIQLPQLIALNKMDAPEAQANLPRIKRYFKKRTLFPISALTGDGIGGLIRATYHRLQKLNEQKREDKLPFEQLELSFAKPRGRFELSKDGDRFVVVGDEPRRAVLMTDMENDQALILLHRKLKKMGLMNALNKAGIKEGDTVQIDEFEFAYSTSGIGAG